MTNKPRPKRRKPRMTPGRIKVFRRNGGLRILAIVALGDGTESTEYVSLAEIMAAMQKADSYDSE